MYQNTPSPELLAPLEDKLLNKGTRSGAVVQLCIEQELSCQCKMWQIQMPAVLVQRGAGYVENGGKSLSRARDLPSH